MLSLWLPGCICGTSVAHGLYMHYKLWIKLVIIHWNHDSFALKQNRDASEGEAVTSSMSSDRAPDSAFSCLGCRSNITDEAPTRAAPAVMSTCPAAENCQSANPAPDNSKAPQNHQMR